MSQSVAFVTPSYRLDRDRCELLNRSLSVCAPSVEHWIVVDRGDLPHFRSMQDSRTHVVAKEEVLPLWVFRLDTIRLGLRSNIWIQSRGWPIRGWLLQQLVKLAVADQLTADVIVHADSDVVLVSPFSTSSVTDGNGRVRLCTVPDAVDESLPSHVRWHRSAEKLLGIASGHLPYPNFISSLVPWKRETAVALLRHIESQTGSHWLRATTAEWHVSEHTLYGRFVQDVLGESAAGFVSSPPLCQDYYKRVPLSESELEGLLDRIGPDEFAVSLTAKGGMRPDDYMHVLERRWNGLGAIEVGARPETDAIDSVEPGREPRLDGGAVRHGKARGAAHGRQGLATRRRRAAAAAYRYGTVCAAAVVAVALALFLFVD